MFEVMMSAAGELSPLVGYPSQGQKSQNCCSCNVKYRLPLITEKGGIVMIVCTVLVFIAGFAQMQRIYFTTTTGLTIVVMAIITFPIAGIVADTLVGRFKVIQANIIFLMLSSLLRILLILLQGCLPTTVETVFVMCSTGLSCIGASYYWACVFPFTADQLIGASGEQLSFAIYWIMWGLVIAYQTIMLNGFILSDYFDLVMETISFLCLSLWPPSLAFLGIHYQSSLNYRTHTNSSSKL